MALCRCTAESAAGVVLSGREMERATTIPLSDFWSAVAAQPGPAPLMRLLSAFDVFSFWSALLVGFGLAAAAQLPRRRALTGTLAAWLCLRLLTHVAMGGH